MHVFCLTTYKIIIIQTLNRETKKWFSNTIRLKSIIQPSLTTQGSATLKENVKTLHNPYKKKKIWKENKEKKRKKNTMVVISHYLVL